MLRASFLKLSTSRKPNYGAFPNVDAGMLGNLQKITKHNATHMGLVNRMALPYFQKHSYELASDKRERQ